MLIEILVAQGSMPNAIPSYLVHQPLLFPLHGKEDDEAKEKWWGRASLTSSSALILLPIQRQEGAGIKASGQVEGSALLPICCLRQLPQLPSKERASLV